MLCHGPLGTGKGSHARPSLGQASCSAHPKSLGSAEQSGRVQGRGEGTGVCWRAINDDGGEVLDTT